MTQLTRALLDRAREAGLLGGGSGLPAHEKLDRPAEMVIANGVACEPLVRSDAHLMAHHAGEVVRGLKLAMQATGAKRGIVAVKRSDKEAIASVSRAIQEDGYAKFHVELRAIAPTYPAGDEKILARELAERAVPPDRSPQDVGVVVFNVMTLYHLSEAHRGRSVTQRMVTVTGAVKTPKTLWAPIGSPFSDLIAAAGGPSFGGPASLLVGGPLRGRLADPTGSLGQATSTIAVLPSDHLLVRRRQAPVRLEVRRAQSACHGCQRCTDLCPSLLRPHRVMQALNLPFDAPVSVFADTLDCSGCNLCSLYACPVELSPGMLIEEIRLRQVASGRAIARKQAKPRPALKVPLGRISRRLGLTGLDHLAPLDPTPLRVQRIELSLDQGGLKLLPSVRKGDRVSFGQIVARPLPGSRGVPLHAGLPGVVRSLGETIVIEESP